MPKLQPLCRVRILKAFKNFLHSHCRSAAPFTGLNQHACRQETSVPSDKFLKEDLIACNLCNNAIICLVNHRICSAVANALSWPPQHSAKVLGQEGDAWKTRAAPEQDAGCVGEGPLAPASGDAAGDLTAVEYGRWPRQRLVGRQVHVHREQVLPIHHLPQPCTRAIHPITTEIMSKMTTIAHTLFSPRRAICGGSAGKTADVVPQVALVSPKPKLIVSRCSRPTRQGAPAHKLQKNTCLLSDLPHPSKVQSPVGVRNPQCVMQIIVILNEY